MKDKNVHSLDLTNSEGAISMPQKKSTSIFIHGQIVCSKIEQSQILMT